MKKHIPNIITTLNLICGCISILFAVNGDLVAASYFVLTGMFFDFFDGLAARLLHVQSKVGVQLDSLADMVTFGVVPGIIMFQLLNKSITNQVLETKFEVSDTALWYGENMSFIPFIGLFIVMASAYRLAKFNIDTRQTDNFIGLPTPANALLIISLPLIYEFQYTELVERVIFNKWILIGISVLGSILLNAELPLFSLKFKTWGFTTNKTRYIFLGLSVIALIALKFIAIPVIIGLYILLSLFWKD